LGAPSAAAAAGATAAFGGGATAAFAGDGERYAGSLLGLLADAADAEADANNDPHAGDPDFQEFLALWQ
jgi:hypothetical protein